jgi:hypothetical protein
MIRKKPALGLDPGVDFRFSEKIMLRLEIHRGKAAAGEHWRGRGYE